MMLLLFFPCKHRPHPHLPPSPLSVSLRSFFLFCSPSSLLKFPGNSGMILQLVARMAVRRFSFSSSSEVTDCLINLDYNDVGINFGDVLRPHGCLLFIPQDSIQTLHFKDRNLTFPSGNCAVAAALFSYNYISGISLRVERD